MAARPPAAARSRSTAARPDERPAIMARVSGPPLFAIDARAAVRPELGGVERWARELSARLPALRPGGYAVLRPPRVLAHRAGHAWEQAVLPLRAARLGASALLCPANLAPVAFRRCVVVLHDAAALRDPGWYSPAYAAWQRRVLPLVARRARHVITVSEFSRSELRELLGLEHVSVVPGGVDPAFSPAADAGRARCGAGPGAALRALRGVPHGAQEPRGAGAGGARAGRRRDRSGRGGRAPAAVRGRAGAGRPAAARARAGRAAAGPVRGRGGVRAALALRGLRPAGARGDGRRGARRGGERGGAAGDVRRTPRGSCRPTARRSATRWWRCCATPPSASACVPPGWSARRGSRGSETARGVDAVMMRT